MRHGRSSPRLLPLLASVLAGCAGAGGAAREPAAPRAEAAARRAFPIPGHGALALPVPAGWVVEEGRAGTPEATIRLRLPGTSLLGLVTPFRNPAEQEDEEARADTARLFAELARRKALPGAAETEVRLEELLGEEVRGFWFAATDRELAGREKGPHEWRHVLQGAAAVGPVFVVFTLLDDEPGPHREAFLAAIGGARHEEGR